MNKLRMFAASLLMMIFGTVFAFADIAPEPYRQPRSNTVYIIVAVVVIIVALVFLRRAIKKRRLENDGVEPEKLNDMNMR